MAALDDEERALRAVAKYFHETRNQVSYHEIVRVVVDALAEQNHGR